MTVGNCIPIDYARGVLGGPDCFEMHRCEDDWFNRLDENSNEKDNQSDQVAHPFSVPINSKIPFFLSPSIQWCDDVIQNGSLFDRKLL